jgi:hypothetical protein
MRYHTAPVASPWPQVDRLLRQGAMSSLRDAPNIVKDELRARLASCMPPVAGHAECDEVRCWSDTL